jgi:holo-[acyl-carrier protein] synthase
VIFGIGTDVVQVARIEEVFARHGEHFVRRLLMPEEEQAFRRYKRPVRFLAMRFAHGIWIRDVGIAPNAWGRPEPIWSERGRALRDRLGAGDGHVTLTDEAGLVVAVAVLMRKESQ